ncbi:MAG: hypothetical protein EAZ30_05310 [Betaproteobacteria bacterium]|nr:MAG: hypothetical protein EAZ30_05310 [Betaproteobacteria bacterium]
MNRTLTRLATSLIAAGLLSSAALTPAYAANHVLSLERHDAATGVTTVDVTFGLDYDPDNATPAERNRQYVTDIANEFAKSLFIMTNGKKRVGNVYVYTKGRFLDNVDALILNKDGRANASINGWTNRGHTSTQYATMNKVVESPVQLGKTIAHEWGHYALGLYDEYKEPSNSTDPTSPQTNDTPRNTIMNNHEEFAGLSSSADYADAAMRATAQFRAHGKPAWETLAANPASDGAVAVPDGVPKRTWWQAFRNLPATSFGTLTSNTGYNAALNVIFMPDSTTKQVLVFDRTLPEALFSAAKRAAEQMLRKVELGSRIAIVAYPNQVTTPVAQITTITEATRTSLIGNIEAITRTSDAGDANAALLGALSLLQSGRANTDTLSVAIFTTTATEVSNETQLALKTAQAAVQPVTVDTTAAATSQYKRGEAMGTFLRKAASGNVLMRDLAERTGGVYRHANTPTEMLALASKSAITSQGLQQAVVTEGEFSSIAMGTSKSIGFQLSSAPLDGDAVVSVWSAPSDYSKLTVSLTSPAGQTVTAPFPTGITLNENSTDGARAISISRDLAGRAGQWKLNLTATGAVTQAVEYDVLTDTRLIAEPDSIGGADEDTRPLVLQAIVRGPQPVANADVVVDIFGDSGRLLFANVPARDDGVAPDLKADDGMYTLAVGDALPQGEYVAVFKVSNAAGTARFTTSGSLRKGVDSASEALGNFTRSAELYFAKETASVAPLPPVQMTMTEYRNKPFDYYFSTATAADKAALDGLADWERTGQSFNVLSRSTFGAGSVARFYFDKVARNKTRGSHFFTVLDGERKSLVKLNPSNSTAPGLPQLERSEGYVYFPAVEGVDGSCVAGLKPVYRVFRGNARFPDNPNHRFTADVSVYNAMVAAGWDGEGVKFCAP